MKHILTIEYCPKCNWLMRAAYMAQEFLTTFSEELECVQLKPGDVNGRYIISVDNIKIFDRKEAGGFIEVKLLKQAVRDRLAPGKELGHSDTK